MEKKIFKTVLWTSLFWILVIVGLWVASLFFPQEATIIIPEKVKSVIIQNSGIEIAVTNWEEEHVKIEEEIYFLLSHIEQMIKANIDNNVKMDTNNDNENNFNLNDNNGIFTIDTIYCLIFFLKLYNHILFKRLYPENYITNFIDVCQLCCKSCLINSNILVDIGSCNKTVLEIILDKIFFFY